MQLSSVHLAQASRVWDPGQKPALSLDKAWLRGLQLTFPPLGAAVHDELLDFAMRLKEVFLELPSAAHAQALPGKGAQPQHENPGNTNKPFFGGPATMIPQSPSQCSPEEAFKFRFMLPSTSLQALTSMLGLLMHLIHLLTPGFLRPRLSAS